MAKKAEIIVPDGGGMATLDPRKLASIGFGLPAGQIDTVHPPGTWPPLQDQVTPPQETSAYDHGFDLGYNSPSEI